MEVATPVPMLSLAPMAVQCIALVGLATYCFVSGCANASLKEASPEQCVPVQQQQKPGQSRRKKLRKAIATKPPSPSPSDVEAAPGDARGDDSDDARDSECQESTSLMPCQGSVVESSELEADTSELRGSLADTSELDAETTELEVEASLPEISQPSPASSDVEAAPGDARGDDSDDARDKECHASTSVLPGQGSMVESSELEADTSELRGPLADTSELGADIAELEVEFSWSEISPCVYSLGLLLAHREISKRVARGAPGLEPDPALVQQRTGTGLQTLALPLRRR